MTARLYAVEDRVDVDCDSFFETIPYRFENTMLPLHVLLGLLMSNDCCRATLDNAQHEIHSIESEVQQSQPGRRSRHGQRSVGIVASRPATSALCGAGACAQD